MTLAQSLLHRLETILTPVAWAEFQEVCLVDVPLGNNGLEAVVAEQLGGLSNDVYKLMTHDTPVVVRLPKMGAPTLVDRLIEFANHAVAAELGLTPAPLFADPQSGVLVTPFIVSQKGRCDPEALGKVIARLHQCSLPFSGQRVLSDWFWTLSNLVFVSDVVTTPLKTRVQTLIDRLNHLQTWKRSPLVPSHWDITPENCLAFEGGFYLIDWEFSAIGPRAWDVAYASLENGFDPGEEGVFVDAYAAKTGVKEQTVFRREVAETKVACDVVSALWALGQITVRDQREKFIGFAKERIERADRQLAGLGL